MHRNQSVNVHQFAMVPRADIPRSTFNMQSTHKTTFDAGYIIPVFVDEVLPGDSMSGRMTAFARLATPLFPIMDNLYMDTFWFFVPYRLVWDNWKKFNGEQNNPGDSTSYVVPQQVSPANGYAPLSLQDYMGLPTVGQITATKTYSHSALPLRAYNLIYNEWFRDENLVNSATVDKGDGPDNVANYVLRKRGKRHDYFTSALPWPQKGSSVSLPLGTSAPVLTNGLAFKWQGTGSVGESTYQTSTGDNTVHRTSGIPGSTDLLRWGSESGLYADLSTATAATINQLRQSFQIQKLLERDARGGTRYTEIIRAHFGVISPDARLQRPEYLGGGTTPININPIAQTSGSGISGGTTPLATLSAMGTVLNQTGGFSQAFTEHGIIMCLVNVRADLTYQQGVRRFWNRNTRYDFYWPAFAMLGEQSVLNREIYATGDTTDTQVFGYQERWAEYRYHPSRISGLFKSTSTGTIDPWHLAQRFTSLPTLNQTFIEENPPLSRVLAVGASANGQQLIFDGFFNIKATRPMPLYSVPGLIDHF